MTTGVQVQPDENGTYSLFKLSPTGKSLKLAENIKTKEIAGYLAKCGEVIDLQTQIAFLTKIVTFWEGCKILSMDHLPTCHSKTNKESRICNCGHKEAMARVRVIIKEN